MSITVTQLAEKIGARVVGDGTRTVSRCAGLDAADHECVSFLANPRYRPRLAQTRAGSVVVSESDVDAALPITWLVAKDAYFAFREAVVALHGFRKHPTPTWPAAQPVHSSVRNATDEGRISPQASVHPTAVIGEGTQIHAFAVVAENARVGARTVIYPHCFVGPRASIGDDCILYPSVTLYDDCVLGHRVTLHAGCVIGQDGFGYATHQGKHLKIPQVGNAVVDDDVELGALCAIDRATIGTTRIGAGTKMSDLIAIGHGSTIGKHNLMVAQVGIAGSVETGDYVVMGGQVGVAGHLKIGSFSKIAATSGVMDDVPEKSTYGGLPAMPFTEYKRLFLHLSRLPDLAAKIKKLERDIEDLKEQPGDAGAE